MTTLENKFNNRPQPGDWVRAWDPNTKHDVHGIIIKWTDDPEEQSQFSRKAVLFHIIDPEPGYEILTVIDVNAAEGHEPGSGKQLLESHGFTFSGDEGYTPPPKSHTKPPKNLHPGIEGLKIPEGVHL